MTVENYISPLDPASAEEVLGYLDFDPATTDPAYSESLRPDGSLVVTPDGLQPNAVTVDLRAIQQPDGGSAITEIGGLVQDRRAVEDHAATLADSRAVGGVSNYRYEVTRMTPSRLFHRALGSLGLGWTRRRFRDPQELDYPREETGRRESGSGPITSHFPHDPLDTTVY